jgi:hypothetical protein
MTTLELVVTPDEGERFGKDAFTALIGRGFPFNLGDGEFKRRIGTGVLIVAVIEQDGRSARLTFDITADDLGLPDVIRNDVGVEAVPDLPGSMSFRPVPVQPRWQQIR